MELFLGFILGSCILLLLVIYKHLTRSYGSLESLGIPVIPPFLCFGSPPFNYHNVQAEEEDEANYAKFKSLTWGFYWGSQPQIVTMDPHMIKEIFVKQFANFPLREGGFHMEDKYLSLDVAGGEKWKAERKLLSPTFTSGKIKLMAKTIIQQSNNLIEHIEYQVKENVVEGEVIDMRPVFHAYAMDVIGECAFGASFGCLGKEKINRENTIFKYGLEVFTNLTMTSALQSYFFHLYFMFPSLYTLIPDFPKDVYDFINKTTKSIMKERDDKGMEDQGDFMDRLRFMNKKIRDSETGEVEGLTEDMVISQGIIFLAAGFETTASTMSILLYNLAKHPQIQEKCYEEIANILADEEKEIDHDTIAEMTYLEACIQETLRLYPIILRNQRYCSKDSSINGMVIKEGTGIIVPTWAMHRNSELFGEDAKMFVPERFLDGRMTEPIANYTFHAFGGGPRSCIGMRFAMTEMKIAMAKLLTTFSFEDEPSVTNLALAKGAYFLLTYPDMKLRIKTRNKH